MSAITTHVLDTARGCPATGVAVLLERQIDEEDWTIVGRAETDADGRARALMPAGMPLLIARYRLTFNTARYFTTLRLRPFFPSVIIVFEPEQGELRYHVPLLLSQFGYTTYRGS